MRCHALLSMKLTESPLNSLMRLPIAVWLFVLAAACRDPVGVTPPPPPPPPFTTMRGTTFRLTAVDGNDLPMDATFPWYVDTGMILVPFTVRAGTLTFSSIADSANMDLGPVDPILNGYPQLFYRGTHSVAYVTADSVTFDASAFGPLSIGPSMVARLRGDTLRLASIPIVKSVPSNFPVPVASLGIPPDGVHTWIFVRLGS